MKAEYGELKKGYGEIRLFPESIDDLWHLRHIIREGDLVFATTFRSVEAATDRIRPEKVEKRPVRLGVRVERVEFSGHGVRLRISGTSFATSDARSPNSAFSASSGRVDTYSRTASTNAEYGDAALLFAD